jgi:hypothetical protein
MNFEICGKNSYPGWENHDWGEDLRTATNCTATLEAENSLVFAEISTTTPDICNDASICLYNPRSNNNPSS